MTEEEEYERKLKELERTHRQEVFKRDPILKSFRRMQSELIDLIKNLYEVNLKLEVRCSVAEEEIIFLEEKIRELKGE